MIKTVNEIKSIKIRNKGIIKKADIKFSKGLNVIIGPNATGKTTVLNYILETSGKSKNLESACLLIDNIGVFAESGRMLDSLSKTGTQVIATLLDDKNIPENANIIRTKDFVLRG